MLKATTMYIRNSLIFWCVLIYLNEVNSAPFGYGQPMQFFPIRVTHNGNPPKFLWNFVGDFLHSQGFLPIEINVPNTVGALYNGAQNVVNGIQTITGNVIQRIPLFNRFTRPETPRPLKYFVLVPVEAPAMIPQQSQPLPDQKYLLPISNLNALDELPQYDGDIGDAI